MRNGEDYETALENIIGISFPKLYAAWTEDLDKRGLEEKVTNIEVEELKFKEAGKKVTEEDDLKEIDNSQARDYVRLGDMLRGRGRLKAALFEYEKANNFDPYSPFIVNRTAFTELSLGIYEKAEEKLIESLKLYPDFVTTYMNLGRVYFKKENFTKAREAYERAISINPFDPEAHIALVSIYERFNMSDKVEIEKEVLKTIVKEETQ